MTIKQVLAFLAMAGTLAVVGAGRPLATVWLPVLLGAGFTDHAHSGLPPVTAPPDALATLRQTARDGSEIYVWRLRHRIWLRVDSAAQRCRPGNLVTPTIGWNFGVWSDVRPNRQGWYIIRSRYDVPHMSKTVTVEASGRFTGRRFIGLWHRRDDLHDRGGAHCDRDLVINAG